MRKYIDILENALREDAYSDFQQARQNPDWQLAIQTAYNDGIKAGWEFAAARAASGSTETAQRFKGRANPFKAEYEAARDKYGEKSKRPEYLKIKAQHVEWADGVNAGEVRFLAGKKWWEPVGDDEPNALPPS